MQLNAIQLSLTLLQFLIFITLQCLRKLCRMAGVVTNILLITAAFIGIDFVLQIIIICFTDIHTSSKSIFIDELLSSSGLYYRLELYGLLVLRYTILLRHTEL